MWTIVVALLPGFYASEVSAAAAELPELIAVTVAPAPEPAPPQEDVPLVMQELIVTAQRRAEPLRDVPVSVVAFSAKQLEAQGVLTTRDLARITPGLQFTEMAGASQIYMRGVGTDSFIPAADPSVATYVDGLYVPSQLGLLQDLGGVERVEVLKGPQGTLFGRNSTAGAINVITRTPGPETEASAYAELSRFNRRTFQVYGSTPLSDTVSVGVSGLVHNTDSYLHNSSDPLAPGELPPATGIAPDDVFGIRIKMRWMPSDDIDIVLGGYRILEKGASSTVGELVDPSASGSLELCR